MTIPCNCPFTLVEYRQLVRMAKQRFPVITYKDYRSHPRFVIWRHDVDLSVEEMHILAGIDTEEGIKSTFFVLLHCDSYNFWDPYVHSRIRQWIEWGHEIGLHFDCGFYGDEAFNRMEELIEFEKAILERVYSTKIHAFSFHDPTERILECQEDYAGLVNTYNRDFFNGPISYVSDSNGRWREKTVRDVLEDPSTTRAQINTHDTWWSDIRIPQVRKLESAFLRAAYERIERYRKCAKVVVEDVI